MKRKILIIGATSAIAQEVAKIYAEANDDLYLVARNELRLQSVANDLQLRCKGRVISHALDLNHVDQHATIIEHLTKEFGDLDIVLIAHGVLPNQTACEADFSETAASLQTNFLSVVSLLTLFANYFESKKKGSIAVITSVAGDRGRQSNYVYGTAKGALNIFLQGLSNRLAKSNVNVLTIKPGFVDTPMTRDYKKGLLWTSPQFVAKKIVSAVDKKCSMIYVPFYWYYIMKVIKAIPEVLFRRLSL